MDRLAAARRVWDNIGFSLGYFPCHEQTFRPDRPVSHRIARRLWQARGSTKRHVCCAGRPEDISVHPEYLRLFGRDLAGLAVYRHHHDHHHDLHGNVVPDAGHDGAPGEHGHE